MFFAEHVQQRWRWSIGSAQLLLYGKYSSLTLMQQLGIIAGEDDAQDSLLTREQDQEEVLQTDSAIVCLCEGQA